MNPRELTKKFADKKFIGGIIIFMLAISFFIANFVISFLRETGNFIFEFADNPEATYNFSWNWSITTHTDMLMGYAIFYGLLIILIVRISYNIKMNFDDLDEGQHGVRKFEDPDELKKQYKIIPAKEKEYEGSGGVIVAGLHEQMKPYRLMIDESPVHTMVIGITRSGKGETFVVPMLDVLSRAKIKPSIVVNDPKGELAGASYDTLIERGYEVKVLNLMEQSMSIGFNPLQLVIDMWKQGDKSKAQQYANSIAHSFYHNPNAKEPFFDNSDKSLVTAIILALAEDAIEQGQEHKVNLYSVATFLAEMGSEEDDDGNNMLDEFFKKRPMGNPAKNAYATSKFSDGKTRSSIFSVAMEKLQIFILEPNARMTSHNTLDLL